MFRLKYTHPELQKKAFDNSRGLCFYCKKLCDDRDFWLISEEDLVIIDHKHEGAIAICHPECHKNKQIEKIRKKKKLLFDITAYPVSLYLIGAAIIIVSLIRFFLIERLEMLPLIIGILIAITGRKLWLDKYIENRKEHEKLKDVDHFYHEHKRD